MRRRDRLIVKRCDRVTVRQVLADVANALQGAIGLATPLRLQTQNVADDTSVLETAIGRAVSALKRWQPRRKGGRP